MLEFDEIDELLGLASGVDGNLRYEGTWLDNLRDGVGIALYPNGDKFEGNHSFPMTFSHHSWTYVSFVFLIALIFGMMLCILGHSW